MKIGISNLPYFKEALEETIPKVKKLGFNCLEIMCEPPYGHPSNFTKERRKNIKNIAKDNEVELLLHAPIADVNFMSLNLGIRGEAQRQIIETIDLAKDWACNRIVFHIGGRPYMGLWDADEGFKRSLEALELVVSEAEDKGVRLLLENDPNKAGLGCIQWEDIEKYMKHFEGRLGFLLDVGHSFMLGEEKFNDFFIKSKDFLEGVHISSNHGEFDEHLGLNEGTLDVEQVVARLHDVGFADEIVIEVLHEDVVIPSKDLLEKSIKKIVGNV